MKFAVYQTRDHKARMDMGISVYDSEISTIASNTWDAGLYTHVANIEADDYNQVFEIGNIGPEQNIERLARMSSVSVGDVIVGPDGTIVVVAGIGFVAFGFDSKKVA